MARLLPWLRKLFKSIKFRIFSRLTENLEKIRGLIASSFKENNCVLIPEPEQELKFPEPCFCGSEYYIPIKEVCLPRFGQVKNGIVLYTCKGCGIVFVDPQKIGKLFEKMAVAETF